MTRAENARSVYVSLGWRQLSCDIAMRNPFPREKLRTTAWWWVSNTVKFFTNRTNTNVVWPKQLYCMVFMETRQHTFTYIHCLNGVWLCTQRYCGVWYARVFRQHRKYSIIPGSRSSSHLPKSKGKKCVIQQIFGGEGDEQRHTFREKVMMRVKEREKRKKDNTSQIHRVYLDVCGRTREQEIKRLARSVSLKHRYLFWHDTYFMYFWCLIFVFFTSCIFLVLARNLDW